MMVMTEIPMIIDDGLPLAVVNMCSQSGLLVSLWQKIILRLFTGVSRKIFSAAATQETELLGLNRM